MEHQVIDWATVEGSIQRLQVERNLLRAALHLIRLECEATHKGQERAFTALSRIDQTARNALAGG